MTVKAPELKTKMGLITKITRVYRRYCKNRGIYIILTIISILVVYHYDTIDEQYQTYKTTGSFNFDYFNMEQQGSQNFQHVKLKLPKHKQIGSDVNVTRIGLSAVHEHFYLNNQQFRILEGGFFLVLGLFLKFQGLS